MIRKAIRTLAALTVLASCNNHSASFRIVNRSGEQLDSVEIGPNTRNKDRYIILAPRETRDYPCTLPANQSDGEFFIRFKKNNGLHQFPLDYFSNGAASHSRYTVEVLTGSVKTEPRD